MDPNGDTASCTFNQDPSLGACGGLEGFQATDVDFTALLPLDGFDGVAGNWDREMSESFLGASLVPGMSLVPAYAD